jgi:energy-coupling factor transporter ATP-binding protein EcfA2
MAFRLMHLFEELNKLGTTVVIATHNEALVERMGHGCLRLDRGRVAAVAGPGPGMEGVPDSSARVARTAGGTRDRLLPNDAGDAA